MRGSLRSLLAVVVAGTAIIAFAQTNPDTDRGAKPGLAYRVDGLDHVNLFNGNVTLNIPIGQTYTINGTLSYGIVASYATNAWDTGHYLFEFYDSDGLQTRERSYRYPAKHTNAGLGWLVTFGKIYQEPDTNRYIYVSPDGSEHHLHGTLHGEPDGGAAGYTRDGTYIRTKAIGTSTALEFPDGTQHSFDASGRFLGMNDRFGNSMSVSYQTQNGSEPHPNSPLWVVSDSLGRQHKIYFRPGWSFYERIYEDGEQPHHVVDKIVLAAFDGTTAEYVFNYDALPPQLVTSDPPNPNLTTSRQCIGQDGTQVSEYVYVPILRSISMPEGASYTFDIDRGDRLNCSRPAFGGYSGNITRLGLPTGGAVEWTYQKYGFPQASIGTRGIGLRVPYSAGIQSRKTVLGGVTVARAEYVLGVHNPNDLWTDLTRQVLNYDGDSTLINATTHYFTGCRSPLDDCSDQRSRQDYGRPFSMSAGAAGNGYLSTIYQEADDEGALFTKRTTYVRYENDAGLTAVAEDSNHRVWYTRTVHDDGSYTDITHSDFDGLGHYRKSVTGGNVPRTNPRTTYTGYNPGAGTYTGSPTGVVPGYTMLSPSSPWILNTYDRQWVSESVRKAGQSTATTQVQETRFCFDSSGFMTSRRTLAHVRTDPAAEPQKSTTDLLSIFERTALPQNGLRITERDYGDDYAPAPLNFTCGTVPSGTPSYRIEQVYEGGGLARSWYVDRNGDPSTFFTVDQTIDLNTGLPSTIRRFRKNASNTSDGTSTTLLYDGLGRLAFVAGPLVDIVHAYSLDPPQITTIEKVPGTNGAQLRTTTMIFDGLGRLTTERRTMPDNSNSERKTEYNGFGWKTKVTDWGATAPTEFRYDRAGRPVLVKAPDQTDATASVLAYPTPFQTNRVTKVHTGTLSDAVTSEEYDGHGRLVRVTEPASSVGGARPVTDYYYDVGSRLAQVCSNVSSATCGQTRAFTYDGRGLLVSETQPESGTTNYVSYDARGHLLRRHQGVGASDLTFVYDAAERLTHLSETVGTNVRPLKRFFFYDANNTTSKAVNGLLEDAVRYNWIAGGATVQVRETYQYDTEGRAVNRVTSDYYCPTGCAQLYGGQTKHTFAQAFGYDRLGAAETLAYPACLLAPCDVLPRRTVTNQRAQGWLTHVTWDTNKVSSVNYHKSGMVKTVTHANGVTDTHNVDAETKTPSRPASIVTSGFTVQAACVAPTFSAQPSSTTIQSGSSVTLSAAAQGDTAYPVTLQWYRGTAPSESNPLNTGSSHVATPSATTSYWVKATNSCGSAISRTATVTVCLRPTIGGGSSAATITRGQRQKLLISNVDALGFSPLTYQWYVVNGAVVTPVAGATGSIVYVSPTVTTTYRAIVTNTCGGTASRNVTVTVVDPPTVPAVVTATYEAALNRIQVTWNASSSSVGISRYLIERRPDGRAFLTGATTFSDAEIVPGQAYSYTVRAQDGNDAYSAQSRADFAAVTAFTDDPVHAPEHVNGATTIRGVHVSELRSAIDAVRALARLNPAWTDYSPATGVIKWNHFLALVERLNEARAEFDLPPIVLTDSIAPNTVVRARQIRELRDGVR